MLRTIRKYETIGFIFTLIIGTLLHFTYKWSGYNNIIACFSATNESVFQHLKLLFFPAMVYTLFEYLILGEKSENIVFTRYIGTFIGMFVIASGYYTYSGIIGTNFLVIDIILFIIACIVPMLFTIRKSRHLRKRNLLGLILWSLSAVGFILCTFFAPSVGIFEVME
jgi:hypothetical protein